MLESEREIVRSCYVRASGKPVASMYPAYCSIRRTDDLVRKFKMLELTLPAKSRGSFPVGIA